MGADRLSALAGHGDTIEIEESEPPVPMLEDFLLRFRRVWAPPGPVAGQPGVPSDRAADLDDELRDLSIELAAIGREGDAIVQAAELEATAITEAARAESMRITEAARLAAPEVRTQKAAARIRDRRAEIDLLLEDAEKEAAAIKVRARSRIDPLVERVVADVFAAQPAEEQHARVVGGG
jgi:hypothetical protein